MIQFSGDRQHRRPPGGAGRTGPLPHPPLKAAG
jgi:hypothetical protein